MRRKKWGSPKRGGLSRKGRLLLFALSLIITIIMLEIKISPILEEAAQIKAHSLAISAMEKAVLTILDANPEYQNYQNLISMEKDNEGKIAVMIPNTMRLNSLVSDVIIAIEADLDKLNNLQISLPLGILTGSQLLAGFGPKIDLPFSGIGSPTLMIKDQFEEAGINQTRHRIWLEIESEILITAPFIEQKFKVATDLLLAESVIIGPIPDTYLNVGLSDIWGATSR